MTLAEFFQTLNEITYSLRAHRCRKIIGVLSNTQWDHLHPIDVMKLAICALEILSNITYPLRIIDVMTPLACHHSNTQQEPTCFCRHTYTTAPLARHKPVQSEHELASSCGNIVIQSTRCSSDAWGDHVLPESTRKPNNQLRGHHLLHDITHKHIRVILWYPSGQLKTPQRTDQNFYVHTFWLW